LRSNGLSHKEGKHLRYVACLDVHLPREASRAVATERIALKTPTSPFGEISTRNPGNSWSGGMTEGQKAAAVWVKPKYKAEVRFLEWTKGGSQRHAQVKQVLV
jgi:hypothetical protein